MPKKVTKKPVAVKKVESESESDDESHESSDAKIPMEGLLLSSEDHKNMIDQVLLVIKKDEQCVTKSYGKVLSNIKWESINIPGFKPDQLKAEFLTLIKPVRKSRTLTEVLNDYQLHSNKYLTSLASDYPKYPATAFNLFCNLNREKIGRKLEEKSGLKPVLGAISKACAEKFGNLNEDKKKVFVDQAKVLREDYNNKIKKFYEDHPELALEKAKELKKGKTKRKCDTPFNYFITKLEEESGSAVNRSDAKVAWENLDIQEKAKIIREVLSHDVTNRKVSKEELNLLDEASGIPKRVPTAINLFFSEFVAKHKKKIESGNIFKVSSEAWNELPQKTKIAYQDKHKILYEQYVKDYEVYIQSLPPGERTNERIKFEKAHKKKISSLNKLQKERNLNTTDVGSLLNGTKSMPTTSTPAPEKNKKRQLTVNSDDDDETEMNTSKKLMSPIKKELPIDSSPTKKKKRDVSKLSDSDASPSKKKKSDKNSDSDVSLTKKKKKKKMALEAPVFPPPNAQLYFMQNQFDGKPENAKEAFKRLSKKELRKIQEQVAKDSENYTENLREYVKTLSPTEISAFHDDLNKKSQQNAMLMKKFDGRSSSSDSESSKNQDSDEESEY